MRWNSNRVIHPVELKEYQSNRHRIRYLIHEKTEILVDPKGISVVNGCFDSALPFGIWLGVGVCRVMAEEMAERLRSFSLTPDEEDAIVIDTGTHARAIEACAFSLVGKLLSRRSFSKAALKETMRKVWGLAEGLRILDVGDNLFHFRFTSIVEMQRVLNGGPWCFNNMLLLLKKWEVRMRADSIEFQEVDFWIQLWGLPFECISQEIGEVIGKRIGAVLEVGRLSETGSWGRYIRVRGMEHGGMGFKMVQDSQENHGLSY
ncbi:hypothetical protein C3L33_05275, partial [Rhododendron williamsianum]